MELELLEARIADELGAAARDLWELTGADPAARLRAEPPILVADRTRAALTAALRGPDPRRAAALLRLALAASFAHADRTRATPVDARSEAAFVAGAAHRAELAGRLGAAGAWPLFLACSGDRSPSPSPSAPPPPPPPSPPPDHPALTAALARPERLLTLVAAALGIPAHSIRIDATAAAAAAEPGRTFIITPGRDVRVRVWRRPHATPRGTLRVLLHELGHALLAAGWRDLPPGLAAPPSRSFDEGVAAWTASFLERPAFLVDVLGLDPAAADVLAAAERGARAARRARLVAAAAAERAFYQDHGAPPWREPLAWTDPGASHSYALAEDVRDRLDHRLGAGWPTGPLAPLAAAGAAATA